MNTTDFIQRLKEDPDEIEKILVSESKDKKWYASIFWNDNTFWTNAFCFREKQGLLEELKRHDPTLIERIRYV